MRKHILTRGEEVIEVPEGRDERLRRLLAAGYVCQVCGPTCPVPGDFPGDPLEHGLFVYDDNPIDEGED